MPSAIVISSFLRQDQASRRPEMGYFQDTTSPRSNFIEGTGTKEGAIESFTNLIVRTFHAVHVKDKRR